MTISSNLLLLVLSIVAFLLAAILSFHWFGSHAKPEDVLGVICVGLALFAAAHI